MSKGTVNKVIILGRLGQDPDVRATAGGSNVVNLSVATNHGIKDQQGNWSDATEWHRVVVFGKSADAAAQYLAKGSSVYIEGRLQTRKWQDQNGQDRYSTEIVCNEMQFIGGRGDQMGGGQQAQAQQDPWGTPAAQPQQQSYQQPQQQAAPQQQPMQQQAPAQQQPTPAQQQQQQQWQQQAAPAAKPAPAAQPKQRFDDFDDDIPF